MEEKMSFSELLKLIEPKKTGDKEWFLSLLNDAEQKEYEEKRIEAVMQILRIVRIRPYLKKIKAAQAEIARIEEGERTAEDYRSVKNLLAEIDGLKAKVNEFKPFFDEPYFARMDLVDNVEGYNSYYIGKKGDVKLEIVDWRAPISRRYYQKSCSTFKINEYDYKTILRRAIRAEHGSVLDLKNEYLSLKGYLSEEEIDGKDQENILDPFLREIIKKRKEEASVKDIIQTIQEKQYEIITLPEKSNFVLQGCAGSGKTMVMLHRLSYLMYNNEEIKPRDVLVITPSDSFNSFIDELSEILELEKVKTSTVYEYFLNVLKNQKIDLTDKIDPSQKENEDYLRYVYSEKFVLDVKKFLDKTYDSLYGLFTGEECKDFIEKIVKDCKKQILAYEGVKNSSMRIRRAVLGEIKERKEGGLYYTKPFRELMNAVLDIDDFFDGTLKSENAKTPDYFYRQLLSFYKSATFAARYTDKIVQEAETSLKDLYEEVEKELVDLKRFRRKIGEVETYLYADRIARRMELLEEILRAKEKVLEIGEANVAFNEFYGFLRGEKKFSAVGGSENFVDIVRYFYKQTVKKYKIKYGMTDKKMYPSDAYALVLLCALTGRRLSPTYAHLFIDEGQDISACEYQLLRAINQKGSFNVFGDIEQNITPYRGVKNWSECFEDFSLYTLNQNYRNTNQIVDYVSKTLQVDMKPIGFDGDRVKEMTAREINSFFKDKKGLKAIICAESKKEDYKRKAYNDLAEKGRISDKKINFMSVYESKGLEFTCVAVIPEGMSPNEKYIAYTRALKELAVVESKQKS